MGKLLYTSDLHLGHRLMMTTRGFASIEEHDETIIANWNTVVTGDDRVKLLGDVALRWDAALHAKLARLNGTIDLITGNHDIMSPVHRDAHKHQSAWMLPAGDPFTSITQFASRRVAGRGFLMSHFPYQGSGDHTPGERYTQYRLPDMGMWLLHGHLHSKDKITGPRQIHVGLDAWDLFPVPEEVILALMEEEEKPASQ